jgi:anti-anti-sigma regulatory factor
MSGRARHGLHLAGDGDAQATEPITPLLEDAPGRLSLGLHQQSLMLGIAGRLNADTAGRLRMFLSMFTVYGGPRELLLDLSGRFAVDEEGMAPIVEADETMHLRTASLRLASVSAAVARLLDEGRYDRTVATGLSAGAAPPGPQGWPGVSALTTTVQRPGRD